MNKLKDFLNLYVGILLLKVPEKDNLIDSYSRSLTEYHEREIEEIKAFYNKTGLFKYGVIVKLKKALEV
ncbi:MAG: hypothetical protein IKT40_03350 [Bacilli bacterium]|nr:hypothetical protein [Bacilli bacterium]